MRQLERTMIAISIVLMGLIAGFFYAYACSVMIGLARASDVTFVETMQWINATVRNAWFAPAFFGSLLAAVATAAVAMARRSPARWWAVVAATCYLAAFVITMGVSVPLNNELAAAGPPGQVDDIAAVRSAYEDPWVSWNIVRTALSTAALGALAWAASATTRTPTVASFAGASNARDAV